MLKMSQQMKDELKFKGVAGMVLEAVAFIVLIAACVTVLFLLAA